MLRMLGMGRVALIESDDFTPKKPGSPVRLSLGATLQQRKWSSGLPGHSFCFFTSALSALSENNGHVTCAE